MEESKMDENVKTATAEDKKEDGEEPKIEKADTGEEVELNFTAAIEEKIKELNLKDLNLQTALLLGIYRDVVPEIVEKLPVPDLPPEEQEKVDLRVELNVKRTQLRNNQTRLKGGKLIGDSGPVAEVPPLDEELRRRKAEVEILEIELQYDQPLNPTYQYERQERYRELLKDIKRKAKGGLVDRQKVVELLEKTKVNIAEENPKLQTRINEIEEKLGDKKTVFINT